MSIFGWKITILYVSSGLVIAIIGGALIEKLLLENQVKDYIQKCMSPDVLQKELHFKDHVKYAWLQLLLTIKKSHCIFL